MSSWTSLSSLRENMSSLRDRVDRVVTRLVLNRVNTMEEFNRYVSKLQPREFPRYREMSPLKRLEFETVVAVLSLELKSIDFLDIGPAFGDSLDVCHERGANRIEFIEWDPFFFTFNRLKGWPIGYQMNHLRGLHHLEQRKFDLIWCKGAISADRFNKWPRRKTSQGQLSNWLDHLLRLGRPGCTIILCPHWINKDGRRKTENVEQSVFARVVQSKGFSLLPTIPNHNHEPGYPSTFLMRLPSQARSHGTGCLPLARS